MRDNMKKNAACLKCESRSSLGWACRGIHQESTSMCMWAHEYDYNRELQTDLVVQKIEFTCNNLEHDFIGQWVPHWQWSILPDGWLPCPQWYAALQGPPLWVKKCHSSVKRQKKFWDSTGVQVCRKLETQKLTTTHHYVIETAYVANLYIGTINWREKSKKQSKVSSTRVCTGHCWHIR